MNSSTKYKYNLILMALFLGLVYLPFFIALNVMHDTFSVSLSKIAWRNDALVFLILYAVFTVPFIIYQTIVYRKLIGTKSVLGIILATLTCTCLGTSMLLPYKVDTPLPIQTAHNATAYMAVIFMVFLMAYFIIKLRSIDKHLFIKHLSIFSVIFIILIIVEVFLSSAAFMEVGVSLFFMSSILYMSCDVYKHVYAKEQELVLSTAETER